MKPQEFMSKDGRRIVVRQADADDAEQMYWGFAQVVEEGQWLPLLEVNTSVWEWTHWLRRIRGTRESILIASVEDDYAGHIVIRPEEWMASKHVARLGIIVIRKYRLIGVGHALMTCAEARALELGYEKLVLSTFHHNVVALSLYHSVGFEDVGLRKRHFKMPYGYVDEVLMEKHIPPASGPP